MRPLWYLMAGAILGFGFWANSTLAQVNVASELPPVVSLTPSLIAASADETAGRWVNTSRCRETSAYITWNTGAASGAVDFETTDDTASSAAPAVLGDPVSLSGTAPFQTIVSITGAQMFLRASVETVMSGGTVSVNIFCN